MLGISASRKHKMQVEVTPDQAEICNIFLQGYPEAKQRLGRRSPSLGGPEKQLAMGFPICETIFLVSLAVYKVRASFNSERAGSLIRTNAKSRQWKGG